MNKRVLRSKSFQATVAVVLAAMFVLAGTFAWNSFNQSRTNVFKELVAPNVNLHDDFEGGPNKDVYVENSGQTNIFVRVRLTEYLETLERKSMVEGHLRPEEYAHNWAPHNGVFEGKEALDNCTLPAGTITAAAWGNDTFHKYYTWLMGGKDNADGWVYYKPATPEQKGEFVTNPDGSQTVINPPQVVSDPLTGTGKDGDAHLEYKAQVEALMATGLDEPTAMEQLGVRKTLTAKVVSMADWLDAPGATVNEVTKHETGNFWVMDEADGWCYWASPLEGGKATGLLLDKVNRTAEPFDSNAEYCINVWLQAVDANDLTEFSAPGNGGMSDNGNKLVGLLTGKLALGEGKSTYQKNDDGSYLQLTDVDGNAVTGAKRFVVMGVDADGKPLGVDAPAANRFEIDSYFTISDLGWNGSEYTNYDNFATAPYYNITTIENGAPADGNYKLTGAQRGVDGNIYLMATASIPDGSSGFTDGSDTVYLGSVLNKTVDTDYKQGALGSGPFAEIYLNGGNLGGRENLRNDPNVTFTTRSFIHLGNGVYTETAGEGRAATGTTYFFAGKMLVKTDITSAAGDDEAAKIKSVFPLQLTVGEKYNVEFAAKDANDSKIYISTTYTPATDGKYTMTELVKGGNGNYYIELDKQNPKAGYIGVGKDGFLGNFGDSTADVRVWPGNFGIGSGDSYEEPEYFEESFLKGKTKDDLAVGKTIAADGYNWVVLGTDEYGNRLIMTTTIVPSMGARAGANPAPAYADSYWPARATSFANSLSTLKPYARTAYLPQEEPYTWATSWDAVPATDGRSVATNSSSGTLTFPLSSGEHVHYIRNNSTLAEYKTVKNSSGAVVTSGLRSRHVSGTNGEAMSIARDGNRYNAFANSNYPPRMAMWVRLSDADSIATAGESQLESWKNMPTVGSTIQFGSYPQNQVAETPAQPLKWKVLMVDGTRAMLTTASHVEVGQYWPTATTESKEWSTTQMRTHLNSTFYNKAFSTVEKSQILPTNVENNITNISRPASTGDNVFIMSSYELQTLRPGVAPASAYTNGKLGTDNSGYKNVVWYWTRTHDGTYPLYGRNGDGIGTATDQDAILCLRPTIWVDLAK